VPPRRGNSDRGKRIPVAVWPVLEDGEWRIDDPRTAPFFDDRATVGPRSEGITEDRHVPRDLEEMTGEYPRESIWDPPR